jgi:hypothetical protein
MGGAGFAVPASIASLMYPAIFAAMVVTQREPPRLDPGAGASADTLSLCPSICFPKPAPVNEEDSDAGAAAARGEARARFTPTGATPAMVTPPIMAAIVSGVEESCAACARRPMCRRVAALFHPSATSAVQRRA